MTYQIEEIKHVAEIDISQTSFLAQIGWTFLLEKANAVRE